MRIRNKATGTLLDADLRTALDGSNRWRCVLVVSAGPDQFELDWPDTVGYELVTGTEVEVEQLAQAGYHLEQAKRRSDHA